VSTAPEVHSEAASAGSQVRPVNGSRLQARASQRAHFPAPEVLKRAARRVLGDGGYNKLRFIGRDWLPGYLPRYLQRRQELKQGLPGQLEDLFIFLTNQCNARCSHCFYIEELGYVPGEMRLADYERLAPSLPRGMQRLTLTGGEAILHPDCEAIIELLSRECRPDNIVLITNGFLPDRVEKVCRALIEKHQVSSRLDVLVSMDGLEEVHNTVRGNPRAWERSNDTLQRLSALTRAYPDRFGLGVVTIIQKVNYQQLEALNEHVRTTTAARHGFEFLRGTGFSLWQLATDHQASYNPAGAELPPPEEWDNILATLQRINRRSGIAHHSFHLTSTFTVEMLRTGKKAVDCVSAGQNVGVLYPTGEVALCEFSKCVGNVRDYDFDFEAVWRSDAANAMRTATSRCYCTHGCYLSKNIEYTLRGQMAMLRQL